MKGIPRHVFPTDFSSCPSAPLSWDFQPGQNPWCLTSGPNEAQALMSHCKNSVRDTAIGKSDGFVWIQREAHSAGCGTLQRASASAMECGVASFCQLGESIC